MPTSTILSDNGVVSGTTGLKTAGGDDGTLILQTTTAGGTATAAMTINTSQAVTFAQTANLPNTFGFKNRIINGAMVIDQRNAGASVSNGAAAYTYSVDRFAGYGTSASKFTMQQSTTVPAGFVNSVIVTSSAATTPGSNDAYGFLQRIEGTNFSDLGFGSANAKTVTISFWVRSSITGTYSVALVNNGYARCYPATYTISAADTWEYKTVTIAGDTSGTWLTTTGIGAEVWFDLGSGSNFNGTANSWNGSLKTRTSSTANWIGTNGATFYITGVQLEVGSTATSFDYRDYGRELAMCQRYFYKLSAIDNYTRYAIGACDQSTSAGGIVSLPVEMRANPTLGTTGTASNYAFYDGSIIACTSIPTINSGGNLYPAINFIHSGSLTTGRAYQLLSNNNTTSYLSFSAEL